MSDKKAMLAAMLAGKPTKESEAMRKIAQTVDGNNIPTHPTYLQEQQYINSLPSASDLNINVHTIQHESKLASQGVKALPPVSFEDMAFLLGDKKGVKRPAPKPLVTVTSPEPIYFAPPKPINEEKDRFDDIDMIEALNAKRGLKSIGQPQQQNKQIIGEGVNTSDLKSLVESMVYEVLGEILDKVNETPKNKDYIKFAIGESIFLGTIEKALLNSGK